MENGTSSRFIDHYYIVHDICKQHYKTIITACFFIENYKHYSTFSLQMSNDYIVIGRLAYEILIIERVYNLGSSEDPTGKHFIKDSRRKILLTFVLKNVAKMLLQIENELFLIQV